MGKLLPWHPKAEICLFNDELMSIDEAMFLSAFFKNEMHIKYVYSEGFYRVEDKTIKEPSIELYVFEKDNAVNIKPFSDSLKIYDNNSFYFSKKSIKELASKEEFFRLTAIGHQI